MLITIKLLTVTLPLLYGLSTANYAVAFKDPKAPTAASCTPFLAFAVFTHAVYVLLRVVHYERFPIMSPAELLTVVAISVASIYLYVERLRHDGSTGAFVLPMVVLLQLLSSALMTEHVAPPGNPLLESTLFGLHTVAAVVGYSAFAVSTVYGVMFLLLYRALKRKDFGLVFERLPSLDEMAAMGFGATLLGWLFLSGTIGLGVVMSAQHFPDFYTDPKFISTAAVWLIYTAAVGAYYLLGWRGARAVYLSLAGFVLALGSMFATHFLSSTFHVFNS